MRRHPGEMWRCEACGEPLIGALTMKGSVAPVELKGKDGANVWLGRRWLNGGEDSVVICAVLSGPLLEKAREIGMSLHRNHFALCPQADRFRPFPAVESTQPEAQGGES